MKNGPLPNKEEGVHWSELLSGERETGENKHKHTNTNTRIDSVVVLQLKSWSRKWGGMTQKKKP